MRGLTNICLALSLAAIPLASAGTVDNRLNPEVKKIVEQQKQNPVFWAQWSNEISKHYGKPNLYNISAVRSPRAPASRTSAPAPKLITLEEYVRENIKNYSPSLRRSYGFDKECKDAASYISKRISDGYK